MTTTNYPEFLLARGDAGRLPLPDASVDLCFGSPPYLSARLYLEDGKNLGIARGFEEWVSWMIRVTEECLRVSRGAVVWVAAGSTKDRNYQPACEALMTDWYRRSGHQYRPCYWHRVGIPGSGGNDWFRFDVEYVMCFKRPGPLVWSDNTAMGHPPKWAPGGEMSHRMSDGKRVNAFGVRMDGVRIGGRRQNGGKASDEYPAGNDPSLAVKSRKICTIHRPGMHNQDQDYSPPALANPGNLIHTNAGGGHTGPQIALDTNEAPFPEDLAKHFIRSLCPLGGTVLDPFSGSATSVATALKHGRRGIGLDLRQSQCIGGTRRVADSLRPVSKLDGKTRTPATGQQSFLDVEV